MSRSAIPALLVAVLVSGCSNDAAIDETVVQTTSLASSSQSTVPPETTAAPSPEPAIQCLLPCDVLAAGRPWREFEPFVAVDPIDPATIVVAYAEDMLKDSPNHVSEPVQGTNVLEGPGSSTIGIRASHDGGRNWTYSTIPNVLTAEPGSDWALFCVYGDPTLGYAPDGTLHLVGIGTGCQSQQHASATFNVFHAASKDDGATWLEPHLVFPGQAYGLTNDKPWMCIDPVAGTLAAAWTLFMPGFLADEELAVSFSEDGGETWTVPSSAARISIVEQVADTPIWHGADGNFFNGCVFGSGGWFHVGMIVPNAGKDTMRVSTTSDLGATWAIVTVAAADSQRRGGEKALPYPYASMAADRRGAHAGRIYGSYVDGTGGDNDVMLAWSDDHAATWSAPVPISAVAKDKTDQFQQAIAVDDAGIVHALYFDRSGSPQNTATHATYARFDPTTGVLLTLALETGWEPDPGNTDAPFLGDYNTADYRNGTLALAWNRVTPQKPESKNTEIPWDLDTFVATPTFG